MAWLLIISSIIVLCVSGPSIIPAEVAMSNSCQNVRRCQVDFSQRNLAENSPLLLSSVGSNHLHNFLFLVQKRRFWSDYRPSAKKSENCTNFEKIQRDFSTTKMRFRRNFERLQIMKKEDSGRNRHTEVGAFTVLVKVPVFGALTVARPKAVPSGLAPSTTSQFRDCRRLCLRTESIRETRPDAFSYFVVDTNRLIVTAVSSIVHRVKEIGSSTINGICWVFRHYIRASVQNSEICKIRKKTGNFSPFRFLIVSLPLFVLSLICNSQNLKIDDNLWTHL